jgi:hypothetical protein
MFFISYIWKRCFGGEPVSASNAARGRKVLAESSPDGEVSPEVVVREISRRMILLLRDEEREIEFKDLCAGLQRVQPLLKGTEASCGGGVSDEVLAEMEREAGLV